MSGIFGKLGLADTDRVFRATAGQRVIYEEAVNYINSVNAEIDRILDKISDTGLHSLSEKEKRILREASKR